MEIRELYISSKETELIDPYRVNNYIDFARKINEFLQIEIKKIPNRCGSAKRC